MSDETKTFNGSGLVVWMRDSKLKYRFCDSQDSLTAFVKQLKETTPVRFIYVGVINWDDKTMESFINEEGATGGKLDN